MYKVEKGDVYGIFSFGRKCPLIVEYGNFGNYKFLKINICFMEFSVGDAIDSIREETGEKEYNMKIKMVWEEFMGEGYKHVV